MTVTRAGGALGIPGLYVTDDPGGVDENAKTGTWHSHRPGLGEVAHVCHRPVPGDAIQPATDAGDSARQDPDREGRERDVIIARRSAPGLQGLRQGRGQEVRASIRTARWLRRPDNAAPDPDVPKAKRRADTEPRAPATGSRPVFYSLLRSDRAANVVDYISDVSPHSAACRHRWFSRMHLEKVCWPPCYENSDDCRESRARSLRQEYLRSLRGRTRMRPGDHRPIWTGCDFDRFPVLKCTCRMRGSIDSKTGTSRVRKAVLDRRSAAFGTCTAVAKENGCEDHSKFSSTGDDMVRRWRHVRVGWSRAPRGLSYQASNMDRPSHENEHASSVDPRLRRRRVEGDRIIRISKSLGSGERLTCSGEKCLSGGLS